MPLLLAIFLFIIWKLMNAAQEAEQDRHMRLFRENLQAGETEYVLAWHIFHDDLMPAIYAESLRRGMDSIGIYDEAFDELGKEMYGRIPIEEATVRAKRKMIACGKEPYVPDYVWRWSKEKHDLSDYTKERMRKPVEERGMEYQSRIDLTFSDYYADNADQEIVQAPPKSDKRRNYFQRAGESRWQHKHYGTWNGEQPSLFPPRYFYKKRRLDGIPDRKYY